MIYIVVPTFNRPKTCLHFVKDLYTQSFTDYLLVLVDHGSQKVAGLVDDKIIHLFSDVNGWARAVNVGLRYVLSRAGKGDSVLIINDDVLLEDDYLESVSCAHQMCPDAVLGTCCIDQRTNMTLRVAIRLHRLKAKHLYLYQNKDASFLDSLPAFIDSDVLTGKGTVFPVPVLLEVGIYNEEKLPHYKADHELVWRAKKKGYGVYACTRMRLRTLSDQKRADGKEPFLKTVKFLFFDMRSTMRLKDWWNYARLAYSFPYALYFFMMNFIYNTVAMIITYIRTR